MYRSCTCTTSFSDVCSHLYCTPPPIPFASPSTAFGLQRRQGPEPSGGWLPLVLNRFDLADKERINTTGAYHYVDVTPRPPRVPLLLSKVQFCRTVLLRLLRSCASLLTSLRPHTHPAAAPIAAVPTAACIRTSAAVE